MPPVKKEKNKTIEVRVSDLEKGLESLLSVAMTNMKMFSDAHTAFVHEISKLKEKVAELEKNI